LLKLPIRNAEGKLEFIEEKIGKSMNVHLGYLPYTTYNIITQAFKFQGFPYDWGDKYSGRDCSSFTSSIYRSFGIYLPRNTDQQEISSDNIIKFTAGQSFDQRIETIDRLNPGALFFMPGHTMMYLGKSGDKHYMIHAFLGYGIKNNNTINLQPVYQVAVTTVDLLNSKGIPYLNEFTSVIEFQ
jgi:cell wall-associated NlpC family hydrolase